MLKSIMFLCSLLALTACSQNQQNKSQQTESTISESERIDTACFLRTSGSASQDTSYIRIIDDGNKITGDFLYMPYEKDSRKGTIEGIRDSNVIKGQWKFMQEGMKDSLPIEFKILGDTLLEKEYTVDAKTGKQFLSKTGDFTLEYKRVNCGKTL